MSISLFVELNNLHKNGTLEIRRDPNRHLPGEGAYTYKGTKISIIPNYTGPAPGNPEFILEQPHDVAWCERSKTFLAAALSEQPEEQEGF